MVDCTHRIQLRLQRSDAPALLMATLEEFKALRDGVLAEVQAELYRLMTADPAASDSPHRGDHSVGDFDRGFLRQMDKDDEFDDFTIVAATLVVDIVRKRVLTRGNA